MVSCFPALGLGEALRHGERGGAKLRASCPPGHTPVPLWHYAIVRPQLSRSSLLRDRCCQQARRWSRPGSSIRRPALPADRRGEHLFVAPASGAPLTQTSGLECHHHLRLGLLVTAFVLQGGGGSFLPTSRLCSLRGRQQRQRTLSVAGASEVAFSDALATLSRPVTLRLVVGTPAPPRHSRHGGQQCSNDLKGHFFKDAQCPSSPGEGARCHRSLRSRRGTQDMAWAGDGARQGTRGRSCMRGGVAAPHTLRSRTHGTSHPCQVCMGRGQVLNTRCLLEGSMTVTAQEGAPEAH